MAVVQATNPSQVLTGTNGIDYLVDVPGGDTLIGLAGDDTYYIYDSGTTLVEQVGGGNDTVYAYVPFGAPSNVETLNVATTWITGIASPAGTTLIAARDAVTLVSGAGNDKMINAGVSFITYEFQVGSGHDVISGFRARQHPTRRFRVHQLRAGRAVAVAGRVRCVAAARRQRQRADQEYGSGKPDRRRLPAAA